MIITYSLNPACIGKSPKALANTFHPTQSDLATFIDSHYLQGQCIAAGIFLTGYRNNDNWLYSSLIIIDIDENLQDIEEVWTQPFVKKHCFAAIPSSSYTPEEKKYHLYFNVDRPIQDEKYYRRSVQWVSGQLNATTDAAMLKPSQPCYGTHFSKKSMAGFQKSIDDNLIKLNPSAIPLDYEYIYAEVKTAVTEILPIDVNQLKELAENHNGTGGVSQRAQKHNEQPEEVKKKITLEALEYVLKDWGRQEYDLWLAVVMSAYAGCSSFEVCQYIINHPDILWDGENEKQNFINWWVKHKNKTDGYTVATLFLLARKKGWLQTTSIDLTEFETFTAKDVGEWLLELPELPKKVLINSGLGTAKTLGAIKVLKALGTPKSVFFAPSIKLCTNLSGVLRAHGVDNTLYIDNGVIKDGNELLAANVLVTTLQSFANKVVSREVDLSQYQFVCIDESDELLSSFARAETGATLGFSSHVRRHESRLGFKALEQIFDTVEYIYMLDGTATQISQTVAKWFTILSEPLKTYKNTWQREKAGVYFLDSIYEARKVIMDAIEGGYKTVIAADTKLECNEVYEYIVSFGLMDIDDILLITGDTHNQSDVQAFFRDVEAGAKSKQVVIYNSAMGSGVSITGTCPAVFVQICKHLSPRKNLQLLNRYRQQSLVYIYTHRGENLYHQSIHDKLENINDVIGNEEGLSGLDYVKRSFLAETIKSVAVLSIIDEYEQRRSYRDFYTGLLEADGREIKKGLKDIVITPDFKQNFTKARGLIEARHELVLKNWREVEPICRDNPPPLDITLLDYAKGLLHTRINNYIPDNDNLDIDDYHLAHLVTTYSKNIRLLERYLSLEKALKTTLNNSKNEHNAITTFNLYLSRLECISQVGLIFDSSISVLELDDINPGAFIRAIELRKATYDMIAGRHERAYDTIIAKYSNDLTKAALSMVKELIKPFGLKLKRTNGKRDKDGNRGRKVSITGNEDITEFLGLRGNNVECIKFDVHKMIDYTTQIRPIAREFQEMGAREQKEVLDRLKDGVLTFEDSIAITDRIF